MILFEKNRYDNGIVSENAGGADIEQSRMDGLPQNSVVSVPDPQCITFATVSVYFYPFFCT